MPGQRSRKRHVNDFYRTPPRLTYDFLSLYRPLSLSPARILEPAAGDGAMLGPLRGRWPAASIDAYDISPLHPDVKQEQFFMMDRGEKYDLIITNPPFSLALRFAQQGLEMLNAGGYLILLLRLAFLASRKRAAFFREHLPVDVLALSKRPSFDEGTTDWSDYAWFVWREGSKNKTFRGRVI